MQVLEIKELITHYSTTEGTVRAVDDVSFDVGDGEIVGLAGESGCGKTTVALSIMRLLPQGGRIIKGKVLLEGEDLTSKTDSEMNRIRWKKISIVFQGAMNALNPVLRVGDQISEAIVEKEMTSKAEALKRVNELFELVGLDTSRIKDYPHEFSGGMRQRVMIAMALACNPRIVILDEPVTALDVIVQGKILDLVKDLQKKLNLAVILITHDLSVIAEICDKAAIMYAGKIVEYGQILDIYKNPKHPYTEGLISAFPSITGEKKHFVSIPGEPPNLINPPSGCRFHPRCSYAMDICHKKEPPSVDVGEGHISACYLAEAGFKSSR